MNNRNTQIKKCTPVVAGVKITNELSVDGVTSYLHDAPSLHVTHVSVHSVDSPSVIWGMLHLLPCIPMCGSGVC